LLAAAAPQPSKGARGQAGAVYDVAVEAAYSPGQWVNFAIGLVTASGALTGLVFVAVSLHAADVLGSAFHRRRAESTFIILLAILAASLLLLLPGQGRAAVGSEMLLIGAVLLYRTARTWPVLRTGLTREATVSYALGAVAHSLLVLGSISLLARAGGGLYVVAAALVLALVRALSDIWILFTGIEEAGASRSTAALGPDDQD
jgi:modulator of FtsH protease